MLIMHSLTFEPAVKGGERPTKFQKCASDQGREGTENNESCGETRAEKNEGEEMMFPRTIL